MILRPLGMSFLRLAMSGFLKRKACYNDTIVLGYSELLGCWVLIGKPVYLQNKRDILKLPSAVL